MKICILALTVICCLYSSYGYAQISFEVENIEEASVPPKEEIVEKPQSKKEEPAVSKQSDSENLTEKIEVIKNDELTTQREPSTSNETIKEEK